MIEGKYQFTPAVVLPGAKRHRQYRRYNQKIGAVAFVAIALACSAVVAYGNWPWFIGGIAALASLVLLLRAHARAVLRDHCAQILRSPESGKEIRIRLDKDGITIHGDRSEWSRFREVAVYADGILLYPSKSMFVWLPRSAFADEEVYYKAARLAFESVTGVGDATVHADAGAKVNGRD